MHYGWYTHAQASWRKQEKHSKGTMAAILGMETEQLQTLCETAAGIVNIANYNCPGQLVISGEVDAVDHVVSLAKAEIGERRWPSIASKWCVPFPTDGASTTKV